MRDKVLSFKEFTNLNEAFYFGKDEKGRGYMGVKAPEGYDVFSLKTLIEIFKDIKNNKEELVKFIKEKSYNFSPFVIILSMMVMGINTQLFINSHPEVLQKFPNIIQKVAEFLNQHPNILKIFQ
jgi:hypothetical protein